MSKNWYKQSMPTIRQIKPFIKDVINKINTINGVNSVFLWGSCAKHIKNNQFVLKDIDIVAVNDFIAEDLLSITNIQPNPFNLSKDLLEDQGFNPNVVDFTDKYIKLNTCNINHWALSSNKKLLHWGAIPFDKIDWEETKKEAEAYAQQYTGLSKEQLKKTSQINKNKWSTHYDIYYNKYLSKMPTGWYELKYNIPDLVSEMIEL